MPALNWHPDALRDVERLYHFLAENSPSSASRAVEAIRDAANQLAATPGIGTPLAEFRQFPARFGRSAYVIRYVILDDSSVLIIRIWHARENRTA